MQGMNQKLTQDAEILKEPAEEPLLLPLAEVVLNHSSITMTIEDEALVLILVLSWSTTTTLAIDHTIAIHDLVAIRGHGDVALALAAAARVGVDELDDGGSVRGDHALV
jgi:hypothetical protein